MEMNQMTGKDMKERMKKERTVLLSNQSSLIFIAGLMHSAENYPEEYVRPDHPDKLSGHEKQCMALDFFGKCVYLSI